MNVERLHAIARSLQRDWELTGVPSSLEAIRTALENLVNQPQQAQYQQQLSESLTALREGAARSSAPGFPPTWLAALDELDLEVLLVPRLLEQVEDVLAQNQLTPSVAVGALQSLSTDLQDSVEALSSLLKSLDFLSVGAEDLAAGAAEIAVLIPRSAVGNDLPRLGGELIALQQILNPFVEAATGTREAFEVYAISSSDFGVFLDVAPEVGVLLAVTVERVVALYKSLLEIRRLRQELSEQGVPRETLSGLDQHANELMQAGIASLAEEVELPGVRDAARSNELRLELRLSLNAIANRIDRGYNIDVRAAEAPADEDEDSEPQDPAGSAALAKILDLSPRLKFINPTGTPMLRLEEGPADGQGTPEDATVKGH